MTHQQKVDLLREDLAYRGVSFFTAAPPFIRMLWALGVAIPPLLFWRPVSLATLYGSLGLLVGLVLWSADGLPDGGALQGTILGGLALLYGLWGVWFYRRKARELNLPSWEQYPAPADASQSDCRVKTM